jgi:hypothetical protein
VIDKPLKPGRRAGKQQMMQRQPIEEVRIAQVEHKVVALDDPPSLQAHIVLLPGNAALLSPAFLELQGIQHPLGTPCPLTQRGRLGRLYAAGFSRRPT